MLFDPQGKLKEREDGNPYSQYFNKRNEGISLPRLNSNIEKFKSAQSAQNLGRIQESPAQNQIISLSSQRKANNFRIQYQENVSTKLLFKADNSRNDSLIGFQNRKSSQSHQKNLIPKKKDSISMGVIGISNISTNLSSAQIQMRIKNAYNPPLPQQQYFGKQKKSRNFAVQKTSAVSVQSIQSQHSQYSEKMAQVYIAQKNMKILKSGKNTKQGFGVRNSKPELEVVGQKSSVINKLKQEESIGLNLQTYFGQMEKEKGDLTAPTKNVKTERKGDVPIAKKQKVLTATMNLQNQDGSDPINYFQNQGKLIKSQQQNTRKQNKRDDHSQDSALPQLNLSQTRSEGQYNFKSHNIVKKAIKNQRSTMTLKDELFVDEDVDSTPYHPRQFIYGDSKKSPEKTFKKFNKNFTEQNVSIDKFPSPHLTVDSRSKYDGIILTPLVQNQKQNAPGTAHTHGDYRSKLPQFDHAHSELYNNPEEPFRNNLDPTDDDLDHIPSVQKITAIRNQRSQGTYRHNHQKISDVLTRYHQQNATHTSKQRGGGIYDFESSVFTENNQMNFGSQSELYDQNSLSGVQVQDINSQINDQHRIMHVSQISQDSGRKTKSYLSKRETTSQDRDENPFNGPKLHLYRKGQSKSSQSKLRKQMTSEQQQRIIEMGSQHKSKQTILKTKDGHINIQSILNAASVHREDSQYIRSQTSNELCQKIDLDSAVALEIDVSSQQEADLKSMRQQHFSTIQRAINNDSFNLPNIVKNPYNERQQTKTSQMNQAEKYLSKFADSQKYGILRPNTTNPTGFQHPKIGTKHPEVFKNVKKNLNASQNIHHTVQDEMIKKQAVRNFSSSPTQVQNLQTFHMSDKSSEKSADKIDNFQTTFQNFNNENKQDALNNFTHETIKENVEPNKITSQLKNNFEQNQSDVSQLKNTQPINSKQIPQKEKNSVAQTPCFAETPNTTNQFKGYKIDEKTETTKMNVKMVMGVGCLEQQDEESP